MSHNTLKQQDFHLIGSQRTYLISDADVLNLYATVGLMTPVASALLPKGHFMGQEKIINVVECPAIGYIQLFTFDDGGQSSENLGSDGIFDGGTPVLPGVTPPTVSELPKSLVLSQGNVLFLRWSGNRWLITTAQNFSPKNNGFPITYGVTNGAGFGGPFFIGSVANAPVTP